MKKTTKATAHIKVPKSTAKSKKSNGSTSKVLRSYPRKRRVKSIGPLLTDLDEMILAKTLPGRINAPYVAGMDTQPIPTNTFQVATSLSQASGASPLDPLGSKEYVVMMFCPVLTHLYGRGGTNQFATSSTLGGLYVYQSDAPEAPHTISEFDDDRYGLSMIEVFGSDITGFAEHGFVWACQLNLKLMAPLANVIGKAFHGRITIGQLRSNGVNQAITTEQLIKIAHTIDDVTIDGDFVLRSAINNNDILFDNGKNINTIGEEYANEYIDYIVIQRAAAALTSGTRMTYSLIGTLQGNAVFWPNALDSMANNLFNINESIDPAKPSNMQSKLKAIERNLHGIKKEDIKKLGKIVENHAEKWITARPDENHFLRGNKIVEKFRRIKPLFGPLLSLATGIGGSVLKKTHNNTSGDLFVYDFIYKFQNLRVPELSISPGHLKIYDNFIEAYTKLKNWCIKNTGHKFLHINQGGLEKDGEEVDNKEYKAQRFAELRNIGMKTENEMEEYMNLHDHFNKISESFRR
mgnify:CR=1 FL=1